MVLTALIVTIATVNYKRPLYLQFLEVISDDHVIDSTGSYHDNSEL